MYKICFWGIFGMSLSLSQGLAQEACAIKLAPETILISKSPTVEKLGKQQSFWICKQAKVTFRAGEATIFVDSGAQLTLNNGTYTVYLKDGALLNINSGVNGIIYYEGKAEIQQQGFRSKISRQACSSLQIDVSEAPQGSCPTPLEYIPPSSEKTMDSDSSTASGLEISTIFTDPEYVFSIPPQASVIPFKLLVEKTTGKNKAFWLCENARISHQGDSSVFFLEEGAELNLTLGSYNTIYLKARCKLRLGIGKENQVFYHKDAILQKNKSHQSRFNKLKSVEFDYQPAPKGGCR